MLILQKYFHEPCIERGFRTLFLVIVLIMAVPVVMFGAFDSVAGDSIPPVNAADTSGVVVSEEDEGEIENQVIYYGKDSTVLDIVNETIRLYGMDSYVKYGEIEVKAARIEFSLADYTAKAFGVPDSTGALTGRPVFKDSSAEFDEDSLAYNFKTQKGISYGVHTQEGEAHLISEVSKKHDNDWVHIRNGMFTTCDNPNPHYHFRLTRAIVVPDDKVVSGPLYMKVRKVPVPLALPFGFFPNRKESTHGILLPGYGNGQNKGYFVQNLGYFIPVSPFLDTRMLFDIYTRGSWSVRNITNYKKRYGYTGSFNISRTVNKEGFEELPSYFRQTTFNVQWNHAQDIKARPNSRFNANVNLGSSQNFRNNLNSSQQDFLSSTFNSGLQWSKTFPGKPYSLAVSANHTQNTQTRQVQATLPSLTLNISRINLFRSLFPASPIGVNGSVNFDNFLSAKENEIQLNRMEPVWRRLQNGVRLNTSASTSWKLGPFLTLNPNINATGVVAFRQVVPVMDSDLGREVLDTVPKLGIRGNWNASVSANTRIYGTWGLRGNHRLKAVRHLIQPSAGLSYTPFQEFTRYGFYSETGDFIGYNPFDAARFKPGNTREAASINVGLNQNFEAKVRDKSSAKLAYKKVKLLEGWRMSTSKNLLADSLSWSNLSMSAFTTIAQNITLNYSSTHSFYDRDSLGREIEQTMWKNKGRLTRMEGANLALGLRFAGGKGEKKDQQNAAAMNNLTPDQQQTLNANQNAFVDFSVPWSFNLNYNLRLNRSWNAAAQKDEDEITQAVTLVGDITLFRNIALSVNTGYDLKEDEFTTTSLGLHWNLHCWEFSANYVPFGIRQSYMVQLNVRSSLLSDLKLQRRGNLGSTDTLLY